METTLSEEEAAQFEALKTEQPIEEPKVEEKEPEAKTEPEVKEPVKEPEVKETKPDKTVPLAALHEERSKRKQQQKELDELREKFARADERMKVLFDKKTEEPKHPDPENDPLGYSMWKSEQLEKRIAEQDKIEKERSGDVHRELETLKYKQYIDQQERNFERSNPDYQNALGHLVQLRSGLLEELGVDDEQERARMVNQDLAYVVQTAIERGKNPAEAVYKMAQKMGYKKAEPDKKLDNIEKGVKASTSLGSTAGKQPTALTAEALAEMSDEEFSKLDYDQFKKVFGGT